jgi:DNA-binding MarR family transcriptional regulator
MSTASKSRQDLMAALEHALRDVSGTGVLFSQAAAERLGVNSTDLECLGLIASGPATAGELAQVTGLTTGAITGVIDRLEHAGYARREYDKIDRRKVRVRAQPEALQKATAVFEPMRRASAEVLSRYNDMELALILDFLTRAQTASVNVVSALRKSPKRKRKSR